MKYYNDDKTQPTAEYINYSMYESVDDIGRFVFRSKIIRNQIKINDICGYYVKLKNKNEIRYRIGFDGKRYECAGKLLWILRNDKPWPIDDNGKHLLVDHIDGNTENNFIDNIRPATNLQNAINQKIRVNNTSGHKGVSWHKQSSKWRAQISHNGKRIHLGSFETVEDAILKYEEKSKEFFGEYKRK